VPQEEETAATGPNQPTLTVDFAGEVHVLEPGDELTFGRGSSNDLEIDSNPQLHRKFGQLLFRDGFWWLCNNGNRLSLRVLDQASRSSVTLTSGRQISLTFATTTIAFEAGQSSYELELELSGAPDVESVDEAPNDDVDDDDQSVTMHAANVPLVGEQRMLAVALSEMKLRVPHKPVTLPTNKSVAHRFGWAMTTFNRKLDRLCKKYARAGVSGLVGTAGGLASDRRTKLVEHLVASGSITAADLELLDAEPEADAEAQGNAEQ